MPSRGCTIGATWQIRLNLCVLRSRSTRVQNPNGRSTVLAQLTAESPYTYSGLLFSQNCSLPRGIRTPSNTWFPGPTRVLNPNGILIVLAVFVDNRRVGCPYIYFTMGRTFPLKIAPSHEAYSILGSLGPPEFSTQTAFRSVQPFLQGSLV